VSILFLSEIFLIECIPYLIFFVIQREKFVLFSLKNLKFKKQSKKNIFSGFFSWVFLGGFILNPANRKVKSGKFDCRVESLSVLLDYR
jgi:hypothetical protein